MNETEIKVVGWVIAALVACFLIYKAATELWAWAGIWLFIVPISLLALAYFAWDRSKRRSKHPWD
jgi:hypothetical protein